MTTIDYWNTAANVTISVLTVMGGSAGLSALLPQGVPGTAWGAVRKVLDFIGANWGNAKNLPSPAVPPGQARRA